jgi:hypothetical protein
MTNKHIQTQSVESPTANSSTVATAESLHAKANRIINSSNIFQLFSAEMEKLGFAGDPSHAKVLFCVGTSRLLAKPMHVYIKAGASSGKSFLMNSVLKFFPGTAKEVKSGLSPKAIVYGQSDLQNRILAIQEASGLNGKEGNFLLRTLQSEGDLRWEVTEKAGDEFTTRTVTRKGPVAVMITTTHTKMHKEDETRALSVIVSDDPGHTRAVLDAVGVQYSGAVHTQDVDFSEWHAFQDWLATNKNEVVIPFAPKLAALYASSVARAKRDIHHVMAAIQVSALMHQANRERDDQGRIVARVQDYAIVREFLAPLINDATGAVVSERVRRIVSLILELGGDGTGETNFAGIEGPTLALLHKKYQELQGPIDQGTVSRWVTQAKDEDFVIDLIRGQGYPSNLIVVQKPGQDQEVLPTVDALEGKADS